MKQARSDAAQNVVIGAGFGGLAAALRLAARGQQVTVVDGLPEAGGRARVLREGAFRYDAGPTVITAPSLLRGLFALFGERLDDHVDLLPVAPYYRMLFADGSRFDYTAGQDALLQEIARMDPADASAYPAYLAATRERHARGYQRLAAEPFTGWLDMLRALPDLVRLRADRSVWDFTCDFFRDDRVRRAFSIQPLLIGGHPCHTPSLYSLIHWLERDEGIWFPRGGTGALVQALVALARRHGVRFQFGTRAAAIEQNAAGQACGVKLQNGQVLPASRVIANADPGHVRSTLLGEAGFRLPAGERHSMSLFVLYFSTRGRWDDLAHHTVLFGERWREPLDDIFIHRRPVTQPRDLSIYLHRPAATDPAMAPQEHDCLYALLPVPNLSRDPGWALEGPRLQRLVLDTLEERCMPGLRERLVQCFHLGPEYFRDQLHSPYGAGFSLAPLLSQSAALRYAPQHPRVGNLFFVGAGVHPGAGVPGALLSAEAGEKLWLRQSEAVAA